MTRFASGICIPALHDNFRDIQASFMPSPGLQMDFSLLLGRLMTPFESGQCPQGNLVNSKAIPTLSVQLPIHLTGNTSCLAALIKLFMSGWQVAEQLFLVH